jgi:hypothetical protein
MSPAYIANIVRYKDHRSEALEFVRTFFKSTYADKGKTNRRN